MRSSTENNKPENTQEVAKHAHILEKIGLWSLKHKIKNDLNTLVTNKKR